MRNKRLVPFVFGTATLVVMLWVLPGGLDQPVYASDGGAHAGTWRHWPLVPGGPSGADPAITGFDPHETVADPTGLTGHVGAPAMFTSMENVCGGFCGLLYWNPTTDVFKAYCVTGGFQFAGDLNLGAAAAAPGSPNFGGGDAWVTVFGNSGFSPYMNFAGTDDLRRYNVGATQATGVRVNPADGKVYLGNFISSGQLIELDPATNAVRKWTVGCKPYNLQIDPPLVYATCVRSGAEPDQIVRLDPASGDVTRWPIPGIFDPSVSFGISDGLTQDQEGNLWFSETDSDTVARLDLGTDCFDEHTKAGMDAPQDVASSGTGGTLQTYFTEIGTGQKLSILTVNAAAAAPVETCVTPTTVTIAPAASTASIVDFTDTPRENTITPVVTAVMSTNGVAIDRFPLPAGRTNPTATTEVVFAGTLFGTFEGTDDVWEFVSDVIVAPPVDDDCGNGEIDEGEECDDGNNDNGDGCSAICEDEDPLFVSLESFTAEVGKRGVTLRFSTTFEIDNYGFRILRGDAGAESLVLVAPFIPARGTETTGADYEFVDGSSQGRGTVLYYLQDIDLFGTVTEHSPITVEIDKKINPGRGLGRTK